jgi:hypothetical protein
MRIGWKSLDLAAWSLLGQRVAEIGCFIGFANFHMNG